MNKTGYTLIEKSVQDIDTLIGHRFIFEAFDIISVCNLHIVEIECNDKIHFYGNKALDLCLKFEECFDDDVLMYELVGIYHYPTFYTKSQDEINNELIHSNAVALALKKEVESILTTGRSIDDNEFTNCQIDAYLNLKNKGLI